MTYIYMSEDNLYTLLTDKAPTDMVLFKVGQSIDPHRRGGQLKQAGKRAGITEDIKMCVRNYIAQCGTDNPIIVRKIEQHILRKVAQRPSALRITNEFFRISVKDREYCYEHLTQWVEEIKGLI
jgi:hypothetical protein